MIKLEISNKVFYLLLSVLIIICIGLIVIAVAPDNGHDFDELDLGPITIDNGNVGIGTTTPEANLDIESPPDGSSALRFTSGDSSNTYNLDIKTRTKNSRMYWDHYTTNQNNFQSLAMTISSNGNIGIGTPSPRSKLDVDGDISISAIKSVSVGADFRNLGTGNSKLSLKTKDIGWDIIATGTTDSTQTRIAGGPPLLFIRDSLSGKKHLTISGAGNIGIGTTTPGATLEVKGTMKVFGNWETKTLETVYQAPSDGFVTILTGGSGSNIWASFITDSSNPPQTSRVRVGPFDGASSPVRKGDFWRVHKTGGTTTDKIHIYWIPLGT